MAKKFLKFVIENQWSKRWFFYLLFNESTYNAFQHEFYFLYKFNQCSKMTNFSKTSCKTHFMKVQLCFIWLLFILGCEFHYFYLIFYCVWSETYKHTFCTFSIDFNNQQPRRPTLVAPNLPKTTWTEYVQAPVAKHTPLGRHLVSKQSNKHFKATLAMVCDA